LAFFFSKNKFFKEQKVVKKFNMGRPNVIESVEVTPIQWNEGCNPTIKKVRKKRKGKKVTVSVANPSFFSFFDELKMPSDDDLTKGNLKVQKEGVEELQAEDEKEEENEAKEYEEDIGERMDRDY
jgi:hypothetical protein